jgi:hypothetical protein
VGCSRSVGEGRAPQDRTVHSLTNKKTQTRYLVVISFLQTSAFCN